MTEDEDVPFARRAVGAAIVTGASGAGLALSLARPWVREGLETAFSSSGDLRRASLTMAKGTMRAALDVARPTFDAAFEAKDRLRRRAVGSLPLEVGGLLEEWRREFIEGEKAVYFGGIRAAGELKPALEMARQRSWELLDEAMGTFDEVVDRSLISMIKVGESLQSTEKPGRPTSKPARKRVRRS